MIRISLAADSTTNGAISSNQVIASTQPSQASAASAAPVVPSAPPVQAVTAQPQSNTAIYYGQPPSMAQVNYQPTATTAAYYYQPQPQPPPTSAPTTASSSTAGYIYTSYPDFTSPPPQVPTMMMVQPNTVEAAGNYPSSTAAVPQQHGVMSPSLTSGFSGSGDCKSTETSSILSAASYSSGALNGNYNSYEYCSTTPSAAAKPRGGGGGYNYYHNNNHAINNNYTTWNYNYGGGVQQAHHPGVSLEANSALHQHQSTGTNNVVVVGSYNGTVGSGKGNNNSNNLKAGTKSAISASSTTQSASAASSSSAASASSASVICETCQIAFPSMAVLDNHLKGSRHARRVKSQQAFRQLKDAGTLFRIRGSSAPVNDFGMSSGAIRCEVCQVSVNSSHQLQAHLTGILIGMCHAEIVVYHVYHLQDTSTG